MPERSPEFRPSRGAILALWGVALVVLCAGLGGPVVQRTQEARVVATAREMLASPDGRQWVVPELNGETRLQKPPLAYWAAAGSFRLFGVSDFAGRLPFALAAWLTLAVVYRLGRGLIDRRFGLFAAAILLSSYMFFRHARLAETDALATLFVTAAVHALWRGSRAAEGWRWVAWFQWAGLAIGLAVQCKIGPGAFPLVFFLAWGLVERNWRALARFVLSGAMLTAGVVGLGWFAYLVRQMGADVFWREVTRVTDGENHPGPFYEYVPQLLAGIAPWTGLFILGLIWAIINWRTQPVARMVTLWAASIIVPLCLMGNKQVHYLLPAMPALAMLAAYAAHRGLGIRADERRGLGWVLAGTLAASLTAPAVVVWAARHQRGFLLPLDVAVALLALAGAVVAASLARRKGLAAGLAGYALAVAMLFPTLLGRWLPSLDPVNHRTIAADLRREYGAGPYVFYGTNESLPLVWNLRQIVEPVETAEELANVLGRAPGTVVIAQTKNGKAPPPVPAALAERGRYEDSDGMVFRIYTAGR